jgi:uncharacterized protein (TIGR03066 family)
VLLLALLAPAGLPSGREDDLPDKQARKEHDKKKVEFKKEKLVGTWALPGGKDRPGGTITFTKDGKVAFALKGKDKGKVVDHKASGTYKLDGKKLKLNLKHDKGESTSVLIIMKLTDTELTTEEEDGKKVTLKKKAAKKE